MKAARLAVIGVALLSGLAAAMLMGGRDTPPPATEAAAPAPEMRGPPTSEVLVSVAEIPVGGTLTEGNIGWRRWPDEAIAPHFIRRSDRPNAAQELRGALTRFPLATSEPINEQRVIRADRPGFMAAILPPGRRAVAVGISPETGVSGFILPNDRVDVILTRRDRGAQGESFSSSTLLRNIRVLAIDQTVQERDGEKVVIGRTATLELEPRQAESLALSRQLGELSLALRSLSDNRGGETAAADDPNQRSGSVTIIRFGIPQQVPIIGR